jgi:hypothetical protein
MDPITLAILGGAAVAKAGAGIAQGVGTARAGKKQMLTREQQEELDALERRAKAGELGLTERQRGGLEQRFLAEQAGVQRQLQAEGLQQAAARGLAGGVSGREAFLAEQTRAGTLGAMRTASNAAMEQANQVAAQQEQARIDTLRSQQREAKALRAQGIAQAVSGGLLGAGEVGMQQLQARERVQLAEIEAAAKAESTESLFNRYKASEDEEDAFKFNFGSI